MKNLTYKILTALLIFSVLPFFHFHHYKAAAQTPVVIVNDNVMTWQYQEPIQQNGRIFVPVREFTEFLGGYVGWHAANQQATLYYKNHVMVLTKGLTLVRLNNERIYTDYPPFTINGRMMIPLRFVAEAFGYEVGWCGVRNAATVNTPGRVNTLPTPTPTPTTTPAPTPSTTPIPTPSTTPGVTTQPTPTPGPLPLPSPTPTPTPTSMPSPSPTPTPTPTSMPTPSPTPLPSPTPTPPGNGNSNGSNNGNTNGNINGNNNGNANNNTNGNGYSAIDVSTAPILPENHPETTITHLFTPADTGTAAYALQAFSAISSVTYFMLPGNRLVIDIHSALSAIEGPFFVDPSLPISDVRSSQFSRRPNITRLVFDLIGPVEYSLTLSVDRRVLTVAFNKNRISDVELITETGTDTLLIRGDTLPAFRYVWDTPNRRLIIDVDNAAMYAPDINVQTATFVSRIETGQHPEGTAFIHVYFKEGITLPEAGVLNFDVNTIGLMFHQAISNVTYDFSARAVRLCRAGGFTMNVSQIQHFDEYLRSRYTMVLPHSANTLEQGIVQVGDGFIDSFMLARDVNGNTQLILNTSQVLAFEIYETPEAYYIFARLPKEVYSLVIVLDPGHGGNDPGVVRNGIREKDLVLTISHKVATLLNAHPYIGVYMTRREDTNPGVFWRAEFAESFADVFLSIHANGFTNTAIHGIETHYAISAAEAQRGQSFTSHTFAQIIQRNKIAQTNAHNRGLFNTPALIVLRESSIPSALAEIGYVSNATEAARLLTPAYQWQIARGIYDAILETHRIIGR